MQCVFACVVLLIILWICVLSAGIGLSDFLESPGIAIDNGVLLLIAAIAALLLLLLFAPAGWVASLIVAVIRVGRGFFRALIRFLRNQEGSLGRSGAYRTRQRSIRSLEKELQKHRNKLENYRNNPDAYDNKGFLKNASPELRGQIIRTRIRNLERQIRQFQKQIDNLKTIG